MLRRQTKAAINQTFLSLTFGICNLFLHIQSATAGSAETDPNQDSAAAGQCFELRRPKKDKKQITATGRWKVIPWKWHEQSKQMFGVKQHGLNFVELMVCYCSNTDASKWCEMRWPLIFFRVRFMQAIRPLLADTLSLYIFCWHRRSWHSRRSTYVEIGYGK